MPKINQAFVRSAFYLYRSHEDALRGENAGGTGFVVSKQVGEDRRAYYGLTNKHVLQGDMRHEGCTFVRLNTTDGRVDVLPFGPEDWEYHPSSADVAAIELPIDRTKHAVSAISDEHFIGEDHGWEVGDDVFMIGLFVDHGGREANRPLARFGNISMVADQRAKVDNQEVFIIDMHSRSGFSGSPVFAYRTFGADLTGGVDNLSIDIRPIENEMERVLKSYKEGNRRARMRPEIWTRSRTTPEFALLGIHCGQFPERWEVKQMERIVEEEAGSGKKIKDYVVGVSGMTCVVPAWKIAEVLYLPKFVEQRKRVAAEPR